MVFKPHRCITHYSGKTPIDFKVQRSRSQVMVVYIIMPTNSLQDDNSSLVWSIVFSHHLNKLELHIPKDYLCVISKNSVQ